MDPLWHELTNGFPDRERLIIVLLRMFAAVLLGAIVGSSVNGLENLRDCERICSLAGTAWW